MLSSRAPASHLFWPVLCALLAYLSIVQIRSAMQESVTADEPVVLAAGYSYLTTGDFRMEPANPPVAKMLAAIPLLRFRISPLRDRTSWLQADEEGFANQWFAANAHQEDAIVFAARLTSIFLTTCLGLAMALWTRARFGAPAALLAIALYAFDPTVTAHGHYVKNDVPVALGGFLSCIAFAAYLRRSTLPRLLLAALALGLAIATKFTALLLLPMIALLYAVWRAQGHKPVSRVQGVPALAALLMLSGGVVFLIYAIPAFLDGASTGVGRTIPAHPFVKGLLILRDLHTMGHPSYLLGEVRTHGWWYYFPVAFAVKMPTATLAFLALAAWTCLRKLRRAALRQIGFDWFVLAVPIAIFSAFPLFSPFDLGIRYLLPIWPFLFILAAAAFTRAQWRHPVFLLLGLGAALAAESIAIYPHYLAFFNVLAGGPAHGPAILADSNIDWGQDAKNLAAWVRAHPPARLTVDYWGSASLPRLGVTAPSIMGRLRAEGRLPQDATAAVSVNLLVGLSPDRGHFGWLRGCQPRARIGYSIYVFDLAQCVPLVESRLSGTVRPAFRGVQHGDFRGAPTPRDPAVPGEVLAFYMTGLGPVTPPVPTDQPAPLDQLSTIDVPLFCRWNADQGGPVADVLFAGLAPGQTGFYQVNIRVPANLNGGRLTCSSALPGAGPAQGSAMLVEVAPQ